MTEVTQEMIDKNTALLTEMYELFAKVTFDDKMHPIPRFLTGVVMKEEVLPYLKATMPYHELHLLYQKVELASIARPTLYNYRRTYPEHADYTDEECLEIIERMNNDWAAKNYDGLEFDTVEGYDTYDINLAGM